MPNEMGIFEVMYNCRAMRRLSAEPVPEDILLELVEAASQAATGSNKQGLRWVIVRDACCVYAHRGSNSRNRYFGHETVACIFVRKVALRKL